MKFISVTGGVGSLPAPTDLRRSALERIDRLLRWLSGRAPARPAARCVRPIPLPIALRCDHGPPARPLGRAWGYRAATGRDPGRHPPGAVHWM